jgi:peroxiredoxin Q/BCP
MNEVPYPAPSFTLPESVSGELRSLDEFRGKWLVLYFYPKDDTPGCTAEACSMRDARDSLTELGADVIGVSKDEPALHEKFKIKYNLNFILLSDLDGSVMKSYGAWGKKMFGKEGVLRKTFIIDPTGTVRKVYGRVTPLGHGKQVIEDLKRLQNNT